MRCAGLLAFIPEYKRLSCSKKWHLEWDEKQTTNTLAAVCTYCLSSALSPALSADYLINRACTNSTY